MKLFDGWTKEEIIEWMERHPEPDCGILAISPELYEEMLKNTPTPPTEEPEKTS